MLFGKTGTLGPTALYREVYTCRHHLADGASLQKAIIQKAFLAAKLSITDFGGLATFREPQELG